MGKVCGSCLAPVLWARTESGKLMPVDREPTEHGNILLSHRGLGEPPTVLYQSPEQIAKLRAEHERSPQDGPLRLYVSHFTTCPNATQHRRRRRSEELLG